MHKKDISVSVFKAHLMSLPFLILPALFAYLFINNWSLELFYKGAYEFFQLPEILIVLVAGTVVHELIHGVFWSILGDVPLRSIKYGVQLKSLTPYAYCSRPIKARWYKLGSLAPGIILGIIPSVIAVYNGNTWLIFFGILFSSASLGDFIILWILKNVKGSNLVEDHPDKVGCYVYTDKPESQSSQNSVPSELI